MSPSKGNGTRVGNVSSSLCVLSSPSITPISSQQHFHWGLSLTPQHLSLSHSFFFHPLSFSPLAASFPFSPPGPSPSACPEAAVGFKWSTLAYLCKVHRHLLASLRVTCIVLAVLPLQGPPAPCSVHPRCCSLPCIQGTESPVHCPHRFQAAGQSDFSLIPEAILPENVSRHTLATVILDKTPASLPPFFHQ